MVFYSPIWRGFSTLKSLVFVIVNVFDSCEYLCGDHIVIDFLVLSWFNKIWEILTVPVVRPLHSAVLQVLLW